MISFCYSVVAIGFCLEAAVGGRLTVDVTSEAVLRVSMKTEGVVWSQEAFTDPLEAGFFKLYTCVNK